MRKKSLTFLIIGMIYLIAFAVWTLLVVFVDVKHLGVNSTTSDYLHLIYGFLIILVQIWFYMLPQIGSD